jgi:hypothetical protein
MNYKMCFFLAASLAALAGCETMQAVGTGTLNTAKGSLNPNRVRVKNASSVPICAVTVGVGGPAPTASSSNNYDDRRVDKMQPLGPGAEGLVDLGAQAATYDLKAFACSSTGSAGPMLVDVPDVKPGQGTILLH